MDEKTEANREASVSRMEEDSQEKDEIPTTDETAMTANSINKQVEEVPTKGYDLEILNHLDDANCSPFETKSVVANSPVSDKTDVLLVGNLAELEEKTETNREASISKMEEDSQEKEEIPTKDETVMTADSINKQVEEVPTMSYDLDILNHLDDANCNPFETKSTVANSPVSDKTDVLLAGNLAKLDEKTEASREASISRMEEDSQEKDEISITDETAMTANSVIKQVEEVSTKSYDLEILNHLNDTNHNLFQTKSSIVNSVRDPNLPLSDKLTKSDAKIENNNKETACSEMTVPLDVSLKISKIMDSSDDIKVIKNSFVLEKDKVPTKTYNLGIMNEIGDCNPLITKSPVTSSPDKKDYSLPLAGELSNMNLKTENACNKMTSVPKEDDSVRVSKAAPTGYEAKITKTSTEEEEIIVPTKGYNLDFLNDLDDTYFNPFQSRSAVCNSPVKEEPDLHVKTDLKVDNASSKAFCNVIENAAKKDKITCTPNEAVIPRSAVEGKKEDTEVPTKKYDLDILNELDSNINPFQTKSMVTNSPVKDEGTVMSLVDKPAKTDITAEDSTKRSCDDVAGINVVDNVSCVSATPGEDCKTVEEQDEVKVPTKTYDLDALNHLDDENFNPFQTKSAVVNSPFKEDIDLSVIVNSTTSIKAEGTSKKRSVTADKILSASFIEEKELDALINTIEGKNAKVTNSGCETVVNESLDSCKPKTTQETISTADLIVAANDVSCSDHEVKYSTNKCQMLEVLEEVGDPGVNPFSMRSSIVNSPSKEKDKNSNLNCSQGKTNKIEDTELCSKKDHQYGCNEMNDEIHIGEGAQKERSAVEDSNVESFKVTQQEEEIKVPTKSYNFEVLDDPNYNPFQTKTTVLNSPVREERPAQCMDNNSNTEIELETEITEEYKETAVNQPINENPQKKEMSEKTSSLDKPEKPSVHAQGEGTSAHCKEYDLGFLDKLDPNFNPLQTKVGIMNSPVKEKIQMAESKDTCVADTKLEVCENAESVVKMSSKGLPYTTPEDMQNSCEGIQADTVIYQPLGSTDCNDQEQLSKATGDTKANTESGSLKTAISLTDEKDNQLSVNPEDTEQRGVNQTKSTNFDFLDEFNDPDYNPFQTKSNVFNSPKREEASAVKEKSEVSSKDSGMFKVPDIPKSEGCILKEEDEQFHDAVDVCMSFDKGSAVTVSKGLVMRESDSLSTEITNEQSGLLDEDEFKNCADFFNNEEELEMLGKAGGNNKVNSIRDSLFIKFDPLAAKRQSLDVRSSCLMSFSPAFSKPLGKEEEQMPVKAQFTSVANETLVDTSIMEATAVEEEGNQTVLSSGKTLNLLDTSVCNQTMNARPLYTEQEMNEALKKQELFLQGVSLRRYQEFQQQLKNEKGALEGKLKAVKKQEEQKTIIITSLEEEIAQLQSDLEKMKKLVMQSLQDQKICEVKHKREVDDLRKKLQEEIIKTQETKAECEKTETALFDLVKKYERTQAIVREQKKNEESLQAYVTELESKVTQKKEAFSEILNVHEEKLKKVSDYIEEMKTAHENEMGKAKVMLKRAEIKIINLKELYERSEKENERLSAFVDDVTNKFK